MIDGARQLGRCAERESVACEERLQVYARFLRAAITNVELKPGWFDPLMSQIALLTGEALRVPRTSLWLFDDAGEKLVCQPTARGVLPSENGPRSLPVARCPGYIAALRAGDSAALAVHDAQRDARLEGLRDYLCETGVQGLLDIPIVSPGGLRGVVCHEDIVPREWTDAEVRFATEVGALLAVTLEAEQRGRAETHARRSEAKYRQLVEALPAVVYSFDAETGSLAYVSPRISELCPGLTSERAVREGLEGWLGRIAPAYRERVRRRVSEVSSGAEPAEFVYPLLLSDGTRRWVRDNCAWVRDEAGIPVAVQGTLVDVTELKEQQFAREEVEQRYRTLFEQADFLTLIVDPQGCVQEVNDRLADVLGVAASEAVGRDAFALAFPETQAERRRSRFLSDMAAGALPARFEATILGKSGERRRVLWNNALIRDPEERVVGVASIGVDITERLQALTAVAQSQKFASLGRFAASVAHDFNNLLAVISTSMALIQRRVDGSSPAFGHALTAVAEAKQLTSSLLKYARQEPDEPRQVNVGELLDGVAPILATIAGPSASFVFAKEVGTEKAVLDPTQFRQVLINLVANARDALRHQTGRISVGCRVEEVDARQANAQGLAFVGSFFVVTVQDDGEGIPAEVLPQIFDPFFTTKETGTGLGLATCEAIVRRAGGYIEVNSEPGRTAFRVYVPLLDTPSNQPMAEHRSDSSEQEPSGVADERKVLVFDAREEVRHIVAAQMKLLGYSVVAAGTHEEIERMSPREPLEFAWVGAVPESSRGVIRALGEVTQVWGIDDVGATDVASSSCPPLSLRRISEEVTLRFASKH